MQMNFEPVATICNSRKEILDDNWDGVISEILLDEKLPEESLAGIEDFSHLEIIYYFHKMPERKQNFSARRPRGNPQWPLTGIFAQRASGRPNPIGSTIVELVGRKGRSLFVKRLDAIDGTPVIDIKPVMMEFLPQGKIKRPDWSKELMKKYW